MLNDLFILIISLLLMIKGAMWATKSAERLAKNFQMSRYVVGFIIVAIISILPETLVAINATIEGIPSFGLGTLFGSNVADLTLVFVIMIIVSGRNIKVSSHILKNNIVYPFLFLIPLIFGLDGFYSRFDGLVLIIAGIIFYYLSFKNNRVEQKIEKNNGGLYKNGWSLIASMVIILIGAHFTVTSATSLAHYLKINPILIAMLVVGLGTTIPETIFSLAAVRKKDDSLAVGDILGTVLADATVVVGIIALVKPFIFSQKIIYVTGVFMFGAACLVVYFMRTGKNISKKEAGFLFFFWLIFVLTEYYLNH